MYSDSYEPQFLGTFCLFLVLIIALTLSGVDEYDPRSRGVGAAIGVLQRARQRVLQSRLSPDDPSQIGGR